MDHFALLMSTFSHQRFWGDKSGQLAFLHHCVARKCGEQIIQLLMQEPNRAPVSSCGDSSAKKILPNAVRTCGIMMQYLSHKRITTQWLWICCWSWIRHALCIKMCFSHQPAKGQTKGRGRKNATKTILSRTRSSAGRAEASDATGVQWWRRFESRHCACHWNCSLRGALERGYFTL